MKLINNKTITHIVITKEQKKALSPWGNMVSYVWMDVEYFKFLWLFKTPWVRYEAGYYKDCERSYIANDTPITLIENRHYVLSGSVWTYPFIEIFCGKDLIHIEYFKTFDEARKHVRENYKEINIKYENR